MSDRIILIRSAQLLADVAADLKAGETVGGDEWPNDAREAKREYDELLHHARELRRIARATKTNSAPRSTRP